MACIPGRECADRITAARFYRNVTWFRIAGYGLWLKWGSAPDLHIVRKTAHYAGRFRWRALKP